MSKVRKIFLFVALPLVIVFAAVIIWVASDRAAPINNSATNNTPEVTKPGTVKTEFTAQIFDPSLISHITPLGELNGGYDEAQAISGIMVWNKAEAVSGSKMIDVYAPTAMTLESYSYHTNPDGNADWTLIFRLNKNVTLKYDHITQAVEKIVAATTSTPKNNSAEDYPKTQISFAPGELIAKTSGTKQAKNWNIYMYDTAQKNKFVNQARYEKSQIGQRLISGVCPFDYYESATATSYLALMGATKAGQTTACGNVSKDVAGTLSGMWHFDNKDGELREAQDGNFASPLSVYKNSAGQVIIDQLNNRRSDIEQGTDPAKVTDSQCYGLVNDQVRAAGYAYFNLVSPTEMQLAYSSSGFCPVSFPGTDAKTYYR
ncbi:MAG: hypothetical protein Q8Q05_02580 [bacterium]|nr:hypothetical protein [bacterium]